MYCLLFVYNLLIRLLFFIAAQSKLNEKRWLVWSNGRISKKACGLLISGASLYFGGTGDRILVARDLDLSRARLG